MKKNLAAILILAAFITVLVTGCGVNSVAAADKPQAGKWKAEFSIKTSGKKDYNWAINFQVSEDGKTVSNITVAHYYGELTSETKITALQLLGETSIDNNSIKFTITEFVNYTSHSYEGKAIFISATEAEGTLDISDTEYKWTAAPVSK